MVTAPQAKAPQTRFFGDCEGPRIKRAPQPGLSESCEMAREQGQGHQHSAHSACAQLLTVSHDTRAQDGGVPQGECTPPCSAPGHAARPEDPTDPCIYYTYIICRYIIIYTITNTSICYKLHQLTSSCKLKASQFKHRFFPTHSHLTAHTTQA